MHSEEILQISQSVANTKELCTTCSSYGLEYLHLLECPKASVQEGEVAKSFNVASGEESPASREEWLRVFDFRSQFQDDCSVCELLISLLPENSSGPWRICWVGFGYWKRRDEGNTWSKREESMIWQMHRTPVIVVAPDIPSEFQEWWENRRTTGFVLPTRRGEDTIIPRARYLDSHSVRYDAAKSWIHSCKKQHTTTCARLTRSFDSLRIIDCHTRTIMPAPPDCEYVALSYVWGTTHLVTPKDLLDWSRVPELIKDTIAATLGLGYKYLWVDYYCIPQDDPIQRQYQIENMDKIYSEAQITIIAACSEDASTGMPGVGKEIRKPSVAAQIGNGSLVAVYSTEVDEVEHSKWSTRGWTFQEGLLASRRILFTDTGMYFQCSGGEPNETCATEALDIELGLPASQMGVIDHWLFPDYGPVSMFPSMIWDSLKNYSRRSLTFESDSLNAFTGILNRFAQSSEHFNHVWGIPVYRKKLHHPTAGSGIEFVKDYTVLQTYSEQLASSLVWKLAEPDWNSTLRKDFPTWSWASLPGVIECEQEDIRNPDLDILIELKSGDRIHIDEYFSMPSAERPKPGKGLYINAPTTFITMHPFLKQDGMHHSVTSLERHDGREHKYAGMCIVHRFPEGFKLGKHLAVILGVSQQTRSHRLRYHLMVLHERDGHYERAFEMEVNDATLEQRVPEEIWSDWNKEACEALGIDDIPFMWADNPADLGFEKSNREKWEKVFLLAKHVRVEQRTIYLR